MGTPLRGYPQEFYNMWMPDVDASAYAQCAVITYDEDLGTEEVETVTEPYPGVVTYPGEGYDDTVPDDVPTTPYPVWYPNTDTEEYVIEVEEDGDEMLETWAEVEERTRARWVAAWLRKLFGGQ